MKLKIDVEIPKWTKWLAAGVVVGLVLGIGTARVYSGTPTIRTSWNTGDTLTASDLSNNFKALQDAVNQAAPPGTIIAYGGAIDGNPGATGTTKPPPTGWLWCNGDAVSRAQYAALLTAIGVTWGSGDGLATFNIPDLRGMFLRGAGANGSKVMADGNSFAGASVGGYQADMSQGHTHQDSGHTHSALLRALPPSDNYGTYGGNANIPDGNTVGQTTGVGYAALGSPVTDGTNGSPRSGSETRPASYGVSYLIKY